MIKLTESISFVSETKNIHGKIIISVITLDLCLNLLLETMATLESLQIKQDNAHHIFNKPNFCSLVW